MKLITIFILVLCLGIAKKHREDFKIINLGQLGVNNVTTFNAQSSKRIVFGDINGNLSILSTQNGQISQPENSHNGAIIKIERIQGEKYSGYVTVDTSAHIVLWNKDMTEIQYQDGSITDIIEANVTDVVLNQRGHKWKKKHYLLALNTQDYVYEYCLTNRKIRRNITKKASGKIVSIAYIDKNIFASIQNDGLYIAGQNDTEFKFLAKAYGQIDQLTTHEENDFRDDDGLAVLNKTSIVHFTKRGFNKRMEQFYGGISITSLNQCQSRQKKQKEDLYVIGFEDGTLFVRAGEKVSQRHISNSRIQAIQCQQDQLLYIDQQNNLVSIQLDHYHHSGTKFSGIAAILLAVFVLIIVACYVKHRREKRKRLQQDAFYHSSYELQERVVYQPPN